MLHDTPHDPLEATDKTSSDGERPESHRSIHRWRTVSIAPAAPGWRAVFKNDGQEREYPVAAFLLQELVATTHFIYNGAGVLLQKYDVPSDVPHRTRVVAGDIDGAEVNQDLPESDDFAYIIGPGESM